MSNPIIELAEKLLGIENEAQFEKLIESYSSEIFKDAWEAIEDDYKNKIRFKIADNPCPTTMELIDMIINAENLAELKKIKANYPISMVREAWGEIENTYPEKAEKIKQMSNKK